MAIGYRYQFIYKNPAGYGWSENYDSSYAPADTFNTILPALIAARLALLSNDCELREVRAASGLYRNPATYPVSIPGTPNGQATGPSAQDFTRILVRTESNLGYGRIFLGGIPQSWVSGDSLVWPSSVQKQFTAFVLVLTANSVNWGMNSVNTGAPKVKWPMNTGIPSSPRGYTFISPNQTLSVGQAIRVTGSTVIGYNGIKNVVYVSGAAPTQLVQVGGGSPSNPQATNDTLLFTYESPNFSPYINVFATGVTHRKSGRPFGVRRGRASNTVPLRR
jgi:hypothetical protein